MGKFFVEIGAANFETLIPLAKNGWSGYVFEPVPYLYEECVETFSNYPVKVFNKAISDFNGTVTMAVGRNDGDWIMGCSHIVDDHHMGNKLSDLTENRKNFKERIQVECCTLDAALADVHHVDFMKVDAEGHENNIFLAYSFKQKPSLLKIEHSHIDEVILCNQLESNGYLVWIEQDDIYGII